MKKNIKWLLFVALATVACTNNDDDATTDVVTSGSANFSNYIALGDSFATGYSDSALFALAQETAYTNILATQLKAAGGGDFGIPYMNDNIGGLLLGNTPVAGVRLYFNGTSPVSVSGVPTTQVNTRITGEFNNFGVPGAKSFHLIAPNYGDPAGVLSGTANPYYTRFASSNTSTVLDDAFDRDPTFFSLWIGGNDVLGYATTGGDGTNPITPTATFQAAYTAIATKMTSTGAKGVVANLAYVSSLPFFTTVPYNPVPLTTAQVTALNAGYAAYNGGLVAAKNLNLITEAERLERTINFVVGTNPVVILDEYLTDITAVSPALVKMRQTTAADYLVLSSQSTSTQAHLAAGNGTSTPLEDRWVLSKAEVAELQVATDAYNTIITNAATTFDLAFVDAKTILTNLTSSTGIVSNGFSIKEDYVTGGGFSLDGIHPSPRGYALIANYFIDAINSKYGSTLTKVNVGDYRILFPASL